MITHHQKAELGDRGFTYDQIDTKTPEETHQLLGLGD